MKKKAISFEKCFAVRSLICYFLIVSLLLFSLLRVAVINIGSGENLRSVINGETIEIGSVRGSILDTNGIAMTNSRMQTVAAVMPTKEAISAVKSNLSGKERERVLSLLENGKPAVCVFKEKTECEGISYIDIPVRLGENTVAHHVVGYLDGDGNGADGIEKAYNDFLSPSGKINAIFPTNGKGQPLSGVPVEFSSGIDTVNNTVTLTLDVDVQRVTEEAAEGLLSGAVVVSDCKTNKIRAMVSLPDFSPYDISESLKEENSPLLNKCLMAYNVGSAFKPCIAAAAIMNRMDDAELECTGSTVIEKRVFNCHKTSGHGKMTLKSALADSCNCYFYYLACSLGAQKVFKAAEYMNFGSRIKLAENIYTSAGNIPSVKALDSKSDIANFGIGQGEILLSPVSMLCLYSAVANKGEYYLPSLVEKTSKGGKDDYYDIGLPTRAMTKEAAEEICDALVSVVKAGTGTAAYSDKVTSAGKTATAQTGRTDENGNEITNSWFCGFFPAENPVYSVVVMSDGKYEKSPAEVFKDISEALSK